MNKFWNFTNYGNGTADLYIQGEIIDGQKWMYDFYGIPTTEKNMFMEELKNLEDIDEINVYINSPGGDLFAGLAINNMLCRHGAKINTIIDGYAASAATLIFMAGDIRKMPKNAGMLPHFALADLRGLYNRKDLEKIGEELKNADKLVIQTFSDKSSASEEELEKLFNQDKLLTAEEALYYGFATELTNQKVKIENAGNYTIVNSVAHKNKYFKTGGTEKMGTEKKDNQNKAPENTDIVAAERERLRAIDEIAENIEPELVNEAKYESLISAEELALKAMQEGKMINRMNAVIEENMKNGTGDVGACAAEEGTSEKKKMTLSALFSDMAKKENAKRMGVK